MVCVNGLTSWLDCFDTTFHTMSETFCHVLAETKVEAISRKRRNTAKVLGASDEDWGKVRMILTRPSPGLRLLPRPTTSGSVQMYSRVA